MLKLNNYIAAFVLFMTVVLSACTQNNGNIGLWFGHWKVTEITINGTTADSYSGNLFFSFQSKVFAQMQKWGEAYDQRFANFEDCGDYIIITFPYVTNEEGNPVYDENGNLVTEDHFKPLEITHMSMGENILNVDQANGGKLQLSMVDAAGETVVFRLEKWK